MSEPLRASFGRPAASKAAGCLVYLVGAPFAALFLTIFVALPIMLALEAWGMSREHSPLVFLCSLPPIALGTAWWAYRDFSRRCALEVVIARDELSIAIDGQPWTIDPEDVDSIRLEPTRDDFACVLLMRSGKAVRLPPEAAPLMAIHDSLDATLIPRLVSRLDERIQAGEAVALRMSTSRSLWIGLRGIGALWLSVVFLIMRPWTLPLGILMVRHGLTVMRQARLGLHGGLVLQRDGLTRPSEPTSEPIPFRRLRRVRSDPAGLVLRSSEGEIYLLSSLTDGFWPALRWINPKVRDA